MMEDQIYYHGSDIEFDEPKVGAYDSIFWTTKSKSIALKYISTGSKISFSSSSLIYPSENQTIRDIQEQLGIIYDNYDEIVFDPAPSNYYTPKIFMDLKEKSNEYWKKYTELDKKNKWYSDESKKRDLSDEEFDDWSLIEDEFFYHKKKYFDYDKECSKLVMGLLKQYGYSENDSVLRYEYVDGKRILLNKKEYPIGYLYTIKTKREMKIFDYAGERESDLTDLDYHKINLFRKVEADGYDGIRITDFAQDDEYGNVGHISYGFFKKSLEYLYIDKVEKANHYKVL